MNAARGAFKDALLRTDLLITFLETQPNSLNSVVLEMELPGRR